MVRVCVCVFMPLNIYPLLNGVDIVLGTFGVGDMERAAGGKAGGIWKKKKKERRELYNLEIYISLSCVVSQARPSV